MALNPMNASVRLHSIHEHTTKTAFDPMRIPQNENPRSSHKVRAHPIQSHDNLLLSTMKILLDIIKIRLHPVNISLNPTNIILIAQKCHEIALNAMKPM